MDAADPTRTPRAQNASFNHAPRYAVIAGQLFPVPLAARPLLSISAFRAKFGFSSLLKKVFEVSLWATLIQDPSARRTKDSQPSGFGFEYCASHVRFRVFSKLLGCAPILPPKRPLPLIGSRIRVPRSSVASSVRRFLFCSARKSRSCP